MHWKNSQFQVLHFLIGNCKTADEAWRLAVELREERLTALASARRPTLGRLWRGLAIAWFGADALDLQAEACRAEAVREVDFLTSLIERLQDQRIYAHLPDDEAFQASQREEWKLKLIQRAQNMYVSMGTIPWDHLETMRSHPDWDEEIKPQITKMLSQPQSVALLESQPNFLLPGETSD